jgi:NADH-quinone oxidoreductase subunit A
VAILFLIFDIEVAYMVPWAVTYGNLGVNAYFIVIFFLVILLIGFIYEISKGSLSEYDTFMVQHSTKFKN